MTARPRIGLLEMYAAAAPGECPFCGDPIPPREPGKLGRPLKRCGWEECRTAYCRLYQRTYRKQGHGLTRTVVMSRGSGNTPPGTVTKRKR